MYAIVEISGHQFKISKGDKIYVNRMESEEGSEISLENVLLVDNDGDIKVGKPNVENASVSAEVIEHVKDDKVLVFKKKRRKGYKKLQGHRQQLSEIEIQDIVA